MQLEITLKQNSENLPPRDLSFLLHKHPDHVHERDLAWGKAYIFYPEADEEKTTAVLYLDIDPVGLVRGRSQHGQSLLAQYVNDRPYAANSFLSVALAKSFGQTLAGKSKERQEFAEKALPFDVRVTPVAVAGGAEVAEELFAPLGYDVSAEQIGDSGFDSGRQYFDMRLTGEARLADILNHLYVLIPVLDNAKHYYVDKDEVDNILAKGEGWLQDHPAKDLIMRRAFKHRRALANMALARLKELDDQDEDAATEQEQVKENEEQTLEKPIRLHELRLDTVADLLKDANAQSVLDLGCGEGKLLRRLVKERGINRIVGVDPALSSLERAADKLYLHKAGEAVRERISLLQGSLTYGDRRWRGFDAATLVEVIEHIDPPRLGALELSLFGFAKPEMVIVTTPNREYNALFENMPQDKLRHPDHRFEWTRQEFEDWGNGVAENYGYKVSYQPLGPEDEKLGGPSQMAVFRR